MIAMRKEFIEDMTLLERLIQTFVETAPPGWFKDEEERQRAIRLGETAGFYKSHPDRPPK